MRNPAVFTLAVLLAGAGIAAAALQRDDAFAASIDHPAIAYSTGATTDRVSALNRQLEDGAARLAFDEGTGYLRSVLQVLQVPIESQLLVFSKTSLQSTLIEQDNPRAVYFTDDVAVGWVRGGDVLEVSAQDARQGTVYYTLDQQAGGTQRFVRKRECLQCHVSWDTRAVPGPLVQTVFPRESDRDYANGFVVDHRVPFGERWGGWWVTGRSVPERHMGNARLIRPDALEPGPPPPELTSVEGRFDLAGFPTPYSDVVALMVLEHQAHLTNLLTRAGWEARVAVSSGQMQDGALTSRVRQAVNELTDYMLFVDEAPLPAPIAGSSGFAKVFAAQGPKDEQGRSLRDFDLRDRLMRYPLSYMIYSPGFDGLPDAVKSAAYRRLWEVLSGEDAREGYAHLGRDTRQAIVEVLQATKPDLPEYYRGVIK